MRRLWLALLAVVPASMQAQRVTTSLSAGATSVRYADEPALSALTLSPVLTYSTPRTVAGVAGTFSLAGEGRRSSQGTLLGALLVPLADSPWLGEVGGAVGGSEHSDGSRTAQLMASARVHRTGSAFAGWTGVGAGSMWDGVAWNGVQQAELGLMRRGARTTLSAELRPTRTADTLRYADAELAIDAFVFDRFEMRGSLGGRMGAALEVRGRDDRVWGDIAITSWIADRLAIVASAGTYPVDPTQGFPSGRFVSIAVRLGGRKPVALRRVPGEAVARREADAAGVRDFEATRLDGDVVRIRVRTTGARRVDLMGDPTTWEPVALERAGDGWWSVLLAAASGVLEVVVRVDGGAWLVPPGLPVVVDEFGGRTGRLVIGEP